MFKTLASSAKCTDSTYSLSLSLSLSLIALGKSSWRRSKPYNIVSWRSNSLTIKHAASITILPSWLDFRYPIVGKKKVLYELVMFWKPWNAAWWMWRMVYETDVKSTARKKLFRRETTTQCCFHSWENSYRKITKNYPLNEIISMLRRKLI